MISLWDKAMRWLRRVVLGWYWVVFVVFFSLFAYHFIPHLSDSAPMDEKSLKTWLAAIPIVLSWTYFFQKQKLAEDQVFLDSFEKFNKRFYELVDDLNKVLKEDEKRKVTNQSESGALDQSATNTQEQESKFSLSDPVIHKYFDLCLEEYQLYKANRIPEKIWKYWAKGMCYYLECPLIRKYWEEMDRNNLSDGLTVEALEKYVGE